jgi:phosphotriesterase-related protein
METVQTVLGPIDPRELGGTMSHVHLTIDILCWHMPYGDPARAKEADGAFTLANIGRVRRNGLAWRRNLVQDDVELTIREVAEYKRAGGGALVNVDLPGMGRDVRTLQRISRETGLHIVASTGFYIQACHPPEIAGKSVEELAEIMIRELSDGIDGTGIRAGNIGEIGLSGMPQEPFQPAEEKVLRAAARAQAATGASLTVHPNAQLLIYGEKLFDHFDLYLDILEQEGCDLGKVYMSHLGLFPGIAIPKRLLARGVGFVSYDHFGHEEYAEGLGPGRAFSPDKEEIALVMQLLEAGLEERVLLCAEIGWKTCYKAYGGWGYSHVYENILPWLKACGATDRQLEIMMVENPRRLHARA